MGTSLRRMLGKMTLIAMFILFTKMVDMKPKHYLIEVADSPKMPKMESGFDYRELDFEYQQHMHQQNPQGPHVIEGGPDKTVDPKGYEKDYEKEGSDGEGSTDNAEEPIGYGNKTSEDEGMTGNAKEPAGYDNKANEEGACEKCKEVDDPSDDAVKAVDIPEEPAGDESKADDPMGYEAKANEDEGSAGKTGEPNGNESKASEDEAKEPSGYEGKTGENDGGAGNTGEPDKTLEPNGYASKPSEIEPEKSSPASSAGKIK